MQMSSAICSLFTPFTLSTPAECCVSYANQLKKKVLPGLFYAVLTPSTMRQGCCTSCRECVCVQPLWPNYANLFNQMQLFPCVYRASFCGCGSAWQRVCSRQRLLRLCCCCCCRGCDRGWKNLMEISRFSPARTRAHVSCLDLDQSAPFFLVFSIFLDFPRSRK